MLFLGKIIRKTVMERTCSSDRRVLAVAARHVRVVALGSSLIEREMKDRKALFSQRDDD